MSALAGKHALVTGGGSGIGAAIAIALAEAGATVTIAGRRREPLDALVAEHRGLRAAVADVTDEASVATLFRDAAADDPIAIVVANAGMAESAPFARTSLDAFERIIAVNLTGVFLTLREGARAMSGAPWGRLIAIASIAGLRGYPYVAPYCASKHGAVGLVRALATELAGSGVTANAICPGYTATPMLEQSVRTIMEKTGRSDSEARKMLADINSGGRLVEPEEISGVVLKLCLPGSEAVSGEAIEIAGEGTA
jgi:NAD(P)-dependent dehydrogenase (short-subunit alcohol dehydrogenase family)